MTTNHIRFAREAYASKYVFVAICDGIRMQFNFKVTDLIDRMSLTHINRTIKFHITNEMAERLIMSKKNISTVIYIRNQPPVNTRLMTF